MMGDPVALVLLVLGAIGWILGIGYMMKWAEAGEKHGRLHGAAIDALYELECEGNPAKAAQHLSKAVGE